MWRVGDDMALPANSHSQYLTRAFDRICGTGLDAALLVLRQYYCHVADLS